MSDEPTQKQEAQDAQTIMQIREVTLAGQKRTFRKKDILQTYEFRKRVGQLLSIIAKPAFDAYMAAEAATRTADGEETEAEWTDHVDIEALLGQLLPLILGDGVDALVDMLWLYAPELKEFEKDSTDDEILDAALEVLDIAFPLVVKVAKRTAALWSRVGKIIKP